MRTTTIDEQLAGIRRRIALLEALVQTGTAARAAPRIRRHVDALHEHEAAVVAAERQAPDEVEELLGRLKSRLAIAEHAAAADVSDDWTTFSAGVEGELRSWDTYLERLQASVASHAWTMRERAEAAIGDVRRHRIAVYTQLAQPRRHVADDWQEQRNRVTAARDDLEQKADELSLACDCAWLVLREGS
jgi:hypothetical protein